MKEMIKQDAVEGFNDGMRDKGSRNVGGNAEMIAVDEENQDLDSSIDKLKGNLKALKMTCILFGVVIAVVLVARLLV